MKFTSLFFACCAVFDLSLGASLYDNKEELANMEHKLDDLRKNLENRKYESTLATAFHEEDTKSDPGRNLDHHSDPAMFKNTPNNKKQKSRPEPPGVVSMEKVLLYTNDADATIKEVTSMGGKVQLRLGKELMVAKISGKVKDHLQSASTKVPTSASHSTLNYAKAYQKSAEVVRGAEHSKARSWADETVPHTLPSGLSSASRKLTMTGDIAVALVLPSGRTTEVAFCEAEVENAVSQVIAGLDFWADQAPDSAQLSFMLYRSVAYIDVENSAECADHRVCHDHYAIPAINYLGYSSVDELEDYMINDSGASSAFVSFITKYRQYHFAYAYFGRGPTYMEYANDGWGTDRIDLVYAHEVGHVFNTPDEYESAGCDCNYQYGEGSCTASNSNCFTCTKSQQECVMGTGHLEVCEYTRKHIGWCGDDGNGCRK